MTRVVCAAIAACVSVAMLAPGLAHAARPAVPCSTGLVALTFDDGPRAGTTARVLDVLAHQHVRATFFVVGSNVTAHPGLVRREVREGHQVGDHTYRHEDLTRLASNGVRSTLARTQRAVQQAGVPPMRLFRPPYGATSVRVRHVAAGLGLHQALWNVDPADWTPGRSAASIRHRVLSHLFDGAVVVLHDGVGNSDATAAALPGIIDGARARGYCFGTLSRSAAIVPPAPSLLLTGATVREGGPGTTTVGELTLHLSEPTSRDVSVRVRTVARTARAGHDYRSVDRRVRVRAGTTSIRVGVVVYGDSLDEPTERFQTYLNSPSNATVGRSASNVLIIDDDPSSPPV